jgi:hypothetical protein
MRATSGGGHSATCSSRWRRPARSRRGSAAKAASGDEALRRLPAALARRPHGEDAEREPSGADRRAKWRQGARESRGRVRDRGEAERRQLARRGGETVGERAGREWPDQPAERRLAPEHEPGRDAIAPLDAWVVTQQPECRAAQHRGMSAPVAEADRVAGRGRLELARRRQAAEAHLVQALAAYPGARGQLRRAPPDQREQLLHAARRRTVEVHPARGQGEEMEVRIDEAGQHGRAPAVDPLGGGRGERPDARRRAQREHSPGADRDRLRDPPPRVEGHDPRVLEEPVGTVQSEDGSGFASLTFIS